MQCKRYLVSGKVQGVYFRASTQRRAKELGITGWVRNLDDGRVEVLACAEAPRLARFYAWLLQGPPSAQVKFIEEAPADYQELSQFEIVS